MEIINIEKLDGHKVIVATGRNENVRQLAKHLKARLYYCPRDNDYFMDYPIVVSELQESLAYEKGVVVVTTQSAEFLDCLLTSEIDFVLATVRKFDQDDTDTYRLRVRTKEEAWKDRRDFGMELRI